MSAVSESSSVAREVLGEKVSARACNERGRVIHSAGDECAEQREAEQDGTQPDSATRSTGGAQEAASMRDRLTKLETLVEVLMRNKEENEGRKGEGLL